MKQHTQPKKKSSAKLGILLGILVLCVLWFSCSQIYHAFFTRTNNTQDVKKIVFQDAQLTVGSKTYKVFPEYDKIHIHDDLLLLVQPKQGITTIFSRSQVQQVRILHKILLDYDGQNVLYQGNDAFTYVNTTSLGVSCSAGFIEASNQVLCILPKNKDNLDNQLVSINPSTGEKTIVYSSGYTLNAVSVIGSTIYIGGYIFPTLKPVVIVQGTGYPVLFRANDFYTLNGKTYIMSTGTVQNGNVPSFSELNTSNNEVTTTLIAKGKIIFEGGGL